MRNEKAGEGLPKGRRLKTNEKLKMQNGETFKFNAQLPMFRDAGIKRTAMPQSARCAGIVCRTRLRRPSARQGATNSTLAGGAESFVKLRKALEVLAAATTGNQSNQKHEHDP